MGQWLWVDRGAFQWKVAVSVSHTAPSLLCGFLHRPVYILTAVSMDSMLRQKNKQAIYFTLFISTHVMTLKRSLLVKKSNDFVEVLWKKKKGVNSSLLAPPIQSVC